jgi:hypothetical protein
MSRKTSITCIGVALLSCLLFLTNGCTVIGFGVGAFVDSRAKQIMLDPLNDLDSLEIGKNIIVQLKDGDAVKGEYKGIRIIDDDAYANRYAEIQKQNPENLNLPAIGDTLTIYMKPAKDKVNLERIFLGLDFSEDPKNLQTFLNYRYTRSPAKDRINLDLIHTIIDRNDREINIAEIDSFIHRGGLSDVTAVALKMKSDERKIAVNNIETIELKPDGKMSKIFGAMGLVTDLVIYLQLKPASENTASTGGG